MNLALERVVAWLAFGNWSMARRVAGSFLMGALMIAAIAASGAWSLHRSGASGQAQWLFGLGLLAVMANVVLGYSVVRWIKRQIGCEPAYATWVAKKISLGNLAIEIDSVAHQQTSLLAAIVSMRDSLADIVSHARSGADSVAQASNSLANVNLDLANKTDQQINSLVNTMTALDKLTAAVKLNSASIGRAHAMVSEAVKSATEGGAAMSTVVTTMSSISGASKKIVDIISVIDSIAFQTNILALNAAV
ncbi:MAG: methyl-accepting chemotaxis protein, partial [Burkholderiaceae bacterium]